MTTHNQERSDDLRTTPPSSGESMRDHHGSLRSKLVLSLAAMFFLFLTIDEIVRQQVIRPDFAELERAGAIRDANRVMAAVNAKVDHLSDLAKHWASRLDHDELENDLSGDTHRRQDQWSSENLGWAAVVRADGTWLWLHKRADNLTAHFDQSDVERFSAVTARCQRRGLSTLSGMTRVADHSLVMFAAVQIAATHDGDRLPDAAEQYLIVGRTIDQAMVAALRHQTQVDFALQSMRTQDPSKRLAIWEADESTLVVEIQVSGVDDEQLANVFVQVPREITAHADHTTLMARNSFIFGSVAALLMLLLLLQRIVIGPLTAIRQHSDRVAEHGFNTEPLVLRGNDEIGELAGAFDHMMHRLGDAQTQLAEASRAAGRSQVASTVIHNVGNVLTNVNSLLDVVADRVDGMRIRPLSKLAKRLREDDNDRALMAATPDYLQGLASSLESDRETVSSMMSTLHDNIRHIHDVIRDQQRHTGHEVERSAVSLGDVVSEAIGCCRARLDQDSIEVGISGCLDVEVDSDRSLLLQSVINIIGNARHALRERDGYSRRLTIAATVEGHVVEVRFIDNGIGMTDDTLGKVFDAHFTTRTSGSGLGLHFCANTLDRLGGSIHAESDGPGLGSTLVIELPLHAPASPTRVAVDQFSLDVAGVDA